MTGPKEATLAVTFRCNSKCIMCNIWKETDHQELPARAYSKLPGSLRTINITGGEPFMRKDLVDVVRNIHDAAPKCRIVISTNGYLTDRIVESVKRMLEFHPRLGLGISVDGIGEVHDRVRGIPGGFERAIGTVRALKALGLEDLRLGMTILPENAGDLPKVHRLAKELGVEFTTTVAHNSGIFFKKTDNCPSAITDQLKADLRAIEQEHLRSPVPKNWFRSYHLAGITDPSIRATLATRCEAASRFFYMDPRGYIYPCIVMDRRIGNLESVEDFDAFYESKEFRAARSAARACKEDCWMVCNIRSLIASHPSAPIMYVAKNKPKAHVSRSRR